MNTLVTEDRQLKAYNSLIEMIEAEFPSGTNPDATLLQIRGIEENDTKESFPTALAKFKHLKRWWRLHSDSKSNEARYVLRKIEAGIDPLEVLERKSTFKLDLKQEHKQALEESLGRPAKFYAYSTYTAKEREERGLPPKGKKDEEIDKEIIKDSALVDSLKDSFIKEYTGTKKSGPLYKNILERMLRDLPQVIRKLEKIKSMS